MLITWEKLCKEFTLEQLTEILRRMAPGFRPGHDSLDTFAEEDGAFEEVAQIGVIELPDAQTVFIGVVSVQGELTARSGKRKQYDLAKRILKSSNHNAGIFAFHDNAGRFRLSLVTVTYYGTRRQFSTFRRYTFFVAPDLPNKTFLQQMQRADFSTLSGILETFSLEAVSNEFYKEFKPRFDAIAASVKGTDDANLKQDFALLFAIRIIFLGFVQKKEWLNDNPKFLLNFWQEYLQSSNADTFYKEWLEPLFFEALSSPPGRKVAYGQAPFSEETQKALQMAPYLNGELFKQKKDIDDQGLWIPDKFIGDYFDFLFQYNFTVEENELYDEELELNPEFLGIIFERITNMDQGAVYTPRVEVDLMCRLALVKWLEQTTEIEKKDLYHLFFRNAGTGLAYDELQKQGDFSPAEIRELIKQLETVTVCDPAAGSGAFEVGMLQVLEQALENLYSRNNTPEDLKDNAPTPFERKKAIIAHSLYGVEVKRWAVWINHLRLWLTLFVDMPDEFKDEFKPLLPNLAFKVRTGDSLVQRIGSKTFPVQGHANLPLGVKRKITELKKKKKDFFYNKNRNYTHIEHEELAIFRAILDAEIAERKKRIRSLGGPKPEQQSFFQISSERDEQDISKESEALLASLEVEINELRAQKRNLTDERPFIWSIEFAEIFFDRGGFDIIIGNPPYLRQEEIRDPNGALDPRAYKEALLEMLRLDFPDYFTKSRALTDQFKTGRQPSGRSDLYTYFYIRSLRLLNCQGVHVFICSNSWLDVGYGAWLQEFFLRQVPLYLVIDNHARRSFARADINTIITVTGAATSKGVKEDHALRFVAFKQPFEDVVLSDNMLAIEQATTTQRNNGFRVFPITVGELLRQGSEVAQSPLDNSEAVRFAQPNNYVGEKWGGKYLRAPDIFFTILEKGKDKLVGLGSIAAEVNEGRPTGANNFFFVPPEVANQFQIEQQYLRPALMKTRGKAFLQLTAEHVERYFLSLPRNNTWREGNVAEYVKYGERQVLPKSRTLKAKVDWWYIPVRHPADLIAPCGYGERVWCGINRAKAITSNSYTEIRLHSIEYLSSIFFTLNHPIGWLFLELVGRASLGGLIKVDPIDYRQILVVRIPQSLFIPFDREVETIFNECGIDPESEVPIAEQEPNPLPDRKALDDIVFDALNLTEEERKEVYRAVCQLVWERISKARSVKRNG